MKFIFSDSFDVDPALEKLVLDFKDATGEDKKKALGVVMEASHAAMINKNKRFYLPSRMKDGLQSFFKDKSIKVLKHHDLYSDPVGVVKDAKFIETIPKEFKNNINVEILMDSSHSIQKQILAMKDLMKTGALSSPEWKGLGYLQLTGDIFDDKTIEQLRDKRFDALSTNFSTDSAYCFICGHDWAKEEGMCDHSQIGKEYEDEEGNLWPMMLIPGSHDYVEVSLVVRDADPHTSISLLDAKETEDKFFFQENKDNSESTSIAFQFKDSEEDNSMSKPKKFNLSDKVKELRPEASAELIDQLSVKIKDFVLEDNSVEGQEEADISVDKAYEYLLRDIECAEVELNAEQIYAEMTKDTINEPVGMEYLDKLPESVFCGANRTFPAHDAEHANAVCLYLDRYQGSGCRIQILTNAKRRLTALGEESRQKDNQPSEKVLFALPSVEEVAALADEDLKILFSRAEALMVTKGLAVKRECSKCTDFEAQAEEAKVEASESKTKLIDNQKILAVLREELKFQQTDYVHQVDRYIDLELKYKENKQEKLAIIGTLLGKYKSLEIAKDSIIESTIADEFDVDKMAEKLNNGMSREPKEGLVDNPTHNIDKDNIQFIDSLKGASLAAFENIKIMLKDGNEQGALRLFSLMKDREIFSQDLDFETVLAVTKETAE